MCNAQKYYVLYANACQIGYFNYKLEIVVAFD